MFDPTEEQLFEKEIFQKPALLWRGYRDEADHEKRQILFDSLLTTP